MTEANSYVNIDYILQRYNRNYIFEDSSLNISDAIEWIGDILLKLPKLYTLIDKVTDGEPLNPYIIIENYRGELPCDLILLEQVRDSDTKEVLLKSTDIYIHHKEPYLSKSKEYTIQNNYIVTNFEEGNLELAYKAMPLDENKKPLIPNDEIVIDAIVKFIAKNVGFKLWMKDLLARDKYAMLSGEYANAFLKARNVANSINPEDMHNIMLEHNRLGRFGNQRGVSYRALNKYSK
jgi:hypothetical protein